MNNKIYRLVQFYLYDHTGIQRYLEKMAAKGWLLDKLGAFWPDPAPEASLRRHLFPGSLYL